MPTFDKIEVVLFRSLWKINFSHLINLPAWKWKWFTVGAWSSQWCWEYGGRCRLEGGRSQGRFDHYINCPLPPPAPHHCHHIWTHSQDYQADTDQEIHLTLIFDLALTLYDKFYVMLWLWQHQLFLGDFENLYKAVTSADLCEDEWHSLPWSQITLYIPASHRGIPSWANILWIIQSKPHNVFSMFTR